MNDVSNYHYFREQEERERALAARDDASRFPHNQLADRHAEMARELADPEIDAAHDRAS